MSSSKFYIWGGGRWREVNTASGEVAGWSRRPHFVFARRGRLRVAARRRVLAALQAHAANLHSSVELGPRLSVLRQTLRRIAIFWAFMKKLQYSGSKSTMPCQINEMYQSYKLSDQFQQKSVVWCLQPVCYLAVFCCVSA